MSHADTETLGHLFVVAAPSGGGKSSLIANLISADPALYVSVSHTTRSQRPGETHGTHYYFVGVSVFEEMIRTEQFIEYAKVFRQYYGTSRTAVEDMLNRGRDVILDIDWQGAQQVRKKFENNTSIFILPPSSEILEQRLRGRQQDSEATIAYRMAMAESEIQHSDEFDHVVVNDNFENALADLREVIAAARETRAPILRDASTTMAQWKRSTG